MSRSFIKRAALLAISIFAFESQALTFCLYARSTNDATSGHAFVTLEDRGRVVESYGFWPEEKHKGSIAINKSGDLPKAVILARANLANPEVFHNMGEASICQEIGNYPKQKIRDVVVNYIATVGKYRTMANNCTHFAIRIYNAITGDSFKVVQTPLRTRKIIGQIESAGAGSYSEWQQTSGARAKP
jgi:hypothetical protein